MQTLVLSPTDTTAPHPSLAALIPKGWSADYFESGGTTYKRAVDPDGCRWYWEGGEWILNVPWFRGYATAVVDHISGERECPISSKNVITIGTRRIPPTRWNH